MSSVTELAMFPLGSVLLPGGVLPLHVFELRYRRLVEDCLALDVPEFGVTLIARGSEVGGGDQRTDVGTVARMVQVGRLEDGRYAVIAVGHRRIRVRRWLDDDPYPRAEVEEWPEDSASLDPDVWTDLLDDVRRRVRRVRALAAELGDLPAGDEPDLPDDPTVATTLLADLAPLGPADRQVLLAAAGPEARLRTLGEMLTDVETVLRYRLSGA